MTSAELTEWMAYERVYGSILIQERIDMGFAQLAWLITRLWAKKTNLKPQDFMPSWYQRLIRPADRRPADRRPDAVLAGFEKLMGLADAND